MYGWHRQICAVVNLANFTKIKDIEVLLNPYDICTTGEDGKVYFISCGDFGGNPAQTIAMHRPTN